MSGSIRRVEAENSGQRIDNFLVRVLKPLPKARIYRMLRRGEVRVNGGRIKPHYRVQAGDELRLPPVWRVRPPPEASQKDAASAPAGKGLIALLGRRTLFEDEGLLIIDKPAGARCAWRQRYSLRRHRGPAQRARRPLSGVGPPPGPRTPPAA